MKTVDAALIMSLEPCDDWPETRVREAVPEEITIVDFLRAAHIPPQDRLWVALHEEFCSDLLMLLFAGDCAERALISEREAGREPDERSWTAVAVARRYALGEATEDELDATRSAASDAGEAVWSAACDAARAAARAAAWSAGGAAWSAALDDAMSAAWTAAWYAGEAARNAAAGAAVKDAAWADERKWQCIHLAEMLEEMK